MIEKPASIERYRELSKLMRVSGITKGTAEGLITLLWSDTNIDSMICWMKQHPNSTVDEICAKARRIHKENRDPAAIAERTKRRKA